jgi:hypothetical protein
MISNLLLHLRKDTYARDGVISLYNSTGIPNIDVNDDGIEAAADIIDIMKPRVIVVHDEPEFMRLARDVAYRSPSSLKIMGSVYEGTGIKIKEKGDYDRLKELGFVIYRSGFELGKLCDMLKKCNDNEPAIVSAAERVGKDPFEMVKKAFREAFEHNYRLI